MLHISAEYVKSCPYLLSFMDNYQYKIQIKEYKPKSCYDYRRILFLDEQKIWTYKKIPFNNARLESLMATTFQDNAEKLLWIPPSLPYYQPGGVYKNVQNFTKTLVFSGWEMVPRIIACMLSYEAERLTVGELYKRESNKARIGYKSENSKRFLSARLDKVYELVFTTASQFLADIYEPIKHIGKSIKQVKSFINPIVKQRLDLLKKQLNYRAAGAEDPSWYWLAPKKIDGDEIEIPKRKMPADIVEVLTNMAMASPAICALRITKDKEAAFAFAKEIVNMFNGREATAIVELIYGRSDDAHYKNVLKYCVDGNFAAVLDEYAHMLDTVDTASLTAGLKVNTAVYSIDTYTSFINDNKKNQIRMRSKFAAGFYQTQIDGKTAQRKEGLRTAFNSPFRPFVLATTSIGQEGLDFHNYSRRVVHWNLPHNPVDIEQREGRVNRYKCLAVRQNIAARYGKENRAFVKDVWSEMFEQALNEKDEKLPELAPYWCLPDGGDIKIERIVPMYPLSRESVVYERLLKILQLYRVTLGQARQEELLEYLLFNCDENKIKDLFINLSPFEKQKLLFYG